MPNLVQLCLSWFGKYRGNRQYQSCPIIKNMFVKVKTKSIVSYIVDVMFLNVLEYKDHL